jgi:hypothetical protein
MKCSTNNLFCQTQSGFVSNASVNREKSPLALKIPLPACRQAGIPLYERGKFLFMKEGNKNSPFDKPEGGGLASDNQSQKGGQGDF